MPKESGGEDAHPVNPGMGRWLSSFKVSVSLRLRSCFPCLGFQTASFEVMRLQYRPFPIKSSTGCGEKTLVMNALHRAATSESTAFSSMSHAMQRHVARLRLHLPLSILGGKVRGSCVVMPKSEVERPWNDFRLLPKQSTGLWSTFRNSARYGLPSLKVARRCGYN